MHIKQISVKYSTSYYINCDVTFYYKKYLKLCFINICFKCVRSNTFEVNANFEYLIN